MMLRYPPFNVQAVCMDESGEDAVGPHLALPLEGVLQAHHKKRKSPL